MKYTKKLLSLVLVLVLALALAVPGMAANITITNSAEGETYNVYKIFDVTLGSDPICGKEVGEDHTHDASCYNAAYTISEDDEWYSVVSSYATAEKGMTLTETTTDGKYNVTVTGAFSAADFATELSKNISDKTVTESGTGNGGALEIAVDDAGYYFVDTTLGSLCSLLTSDQSVQLVEKNSIPTLDKFVQEDRNSFWGEKATADYGQSVNFKLTVKTGTNTAGNGTGVDGTYEIKDVIPANMTLDNKGDTENPAYITMPAGWTKDTDYTESYDAMTRTLTITLNASKLGTQNTSIDITYSATLNKSATVNVQETNTATLKYKAQTSQDTASVITYSIGGTSDAATITKVDGETHEALPGVKFVLMKGAQYATFDENQKLTGWVSDQKDATELVTDSEGHIYAYGLDADTYTLKETYTLPGYNLLDDTINVVIDEDGTVTYDYTNEDDVADNEITIVNNAGTVLPGTGGMGTTIFYTLGGVLVVGAAILLVTKKRVHDVED